MSSKTNLENKSFIWNQRSLFLWYSFGIDLFLSSFTSGDQKKKLHFLFTIVFWFYQMILQIKCCMWTSQIGWYSLFISWHLYVYLVWTVICLKNVQQCELSELSDNKPTFTKLHDLFTCIEKYTFYTSVSEW